MTRLNLGIAALVIVGIAGHVAAFRERPSTAICGTDFPIFYAGAKLLGTPDLYSPEAVKTIQRAEIGCISQAAAFIRLPYFGAFVWPFAQLPLASAFALWRVALVAAALVFVALQGRYWKWALVACAWSFPLSWDIDNGQDVSFLLAALAGTAILMKRGRPFPAGLCLALCAAKFHLVLLVPLALLARKQWRGLAGLATGGFVLTAISFAVAGWGWPGEYLVAISNRNIDPAPLQLHNLRGLVRGALPVEIALGITVALAVWFVARRAPFPIAFSAALGASVLTSHHMTPSDWAILLPAGILLAIEEPVRELRIVAVLLISPLMVLFDRIPLLQHLPDLTLLMLVYALTYRYWQRSTGTKVILTSAAGERIF